MSDRSLSPVSTPHRHRRDLTRAPACDRCRRRKQKCDGRIPCGSCSAGKTTCVPSTRLAKSHECECECDSLHSRLKTAEQQHAALLSDFEIVQDSDQGLAQAESPLQSISATSSPTERTTYVPSTRLTQSHECEYECDSLHSRLESVEQDYAALLRELERLEDSDQGLAQAESPLHSISATSSPTGRTTCVPSTRLAQSHKYECECDSLHSRLETVEQQFAAVWSYLEGTQDSDQGLAQAESPRQSTSATSSPNASCDMRFTQNPQANLDYHPSHRILQPSFTEPDEATYVRLVNIFFDRSWAYLPVLHRPSFVREHLTPFLAGSPTTTKTSKFLVNIVCAIAAKDKAWTRELGLQRHEQFHRRTKLIFIAPRTTIEHFEWVQCTLLKCMYEDIEPESFGICRTSEQILTAAVELNLHRKESISGQTLLRAELSKRVFWSAYVTHIRTAMNTGRPIMIQESDITMPLPLQLSDEQLTDSFDVPELNELALPQLMDTSTFNHIIKLRLMNSAIWKVLLFIRSGPLGSMELETTRKAWFHGLNQWLISSPRYIGAVSTYQSTEWFQIAFHHAVISLYRPSPAAPMPSFDDLRICTQSAIGLITSYSSLYAQNRIKYSLATIHSLFVAALTMLYALRVSPKLCREFTEPILETNIQMLVTLFRGISDGRTIGERWSRITDELGNSVLRLAFDGDPILEDVDVDFQLWFGLRSHAVAMPVRDEEISAEFLHTYYGKFLDPKLDLPWTYLFADGVDMGSSELWCFSFIEGQISH